MKFKLYYVKAYNHRENTHSRWLASGSVDGDSAALALANVEEELGPEYKVRGMRFICLTDDDVFTEVS